MGTNQFELDKKYKKYMTKEMENGNSTAEIVLPESMISQLSEDEIFEKKLLVSITKQYE